MHHSNQEVRQTPESLAVSALRGGRDENADDGTENGIRRGACKLSVNGISRSSRETCIIVLIEDTRCNAADGADDAVHDGPADRGVLGVGVAGDGIAEAIHGGQRPDQQSREEDRGRGNADVQEDLQFMGADPDQRERDDAEDAIGEETRRRETGRVKVVRDALLKVGPDGFQTDIDTVAADPGLHGIPHKRQQDTVVHDKRRSVHAPDISVCDRESQVVEGTRHTIQHNLSMVCLLKIPSPNGTICERHTNIMERIAPTIMTIMACHHVRPSAIRELPVM